MVPKKYNCLRNLKNRREIHPIGFFTDFTHQREWGSLPMIMKDQLNFLRMGSHQSQPRDIFKRKSNAEHKKSQNSHANLLAENMFPKLN